MFLSMLNGAAKVMGVACGLLGVDTATEVLQTAILSSDGDDDGTIKHGKACGIRRIFASSIGRDLDSSVSAEAQALAASYMKDDKVSVKQAGCVAAGAVGPSNNRLSIPLELISRQTHLGDRRLIDG